MLLLIAFSFYPFRAVRALWRRWLRRWSQRPPAATGNLPSARILYSPPSVSLIRRNLDPRLADCRIVRDVHADHRVPYFISNFANRNLILHLHVVSFPPGLSELFSTDKDNVAKPLLLRNEKVQLFCGIKQYA
jgi:hypothetical protein